MPEEIELTAPRPTASRGESTAKNPFRTPSTASLADYEGFSRSGSATPAAQLPDLPSTPPPAATPPPGQTSDSRRSEVESQNEEEAGKRMRRMSMGDETTADGIELPPIDKGKGAWSFCFAAFILETCAQLSFASPQRNIDPHSGTDSIALWPTAASSGVRLPSRAYTTKVRAEELTLCPSRLLLHLPLCPRLPRVARPMAEREHRCAQCHRHSPACRHVHLPRKRRSSAANRKRPDPHWLHLKQCLIISFFRRYPDWVRFSLWASVLVNCLSMLVASWATKVWHLIILQGLLCGLSGSVLYTPVLLWLNGWFHLKRGIATGLVFSGASPALPFHLT